MNKYNIQRAITKLYEELPNLGTISVEECVWFGPQRLDYTKHPNSGVTVNVFNKSSFLVNQTQFPLDLTILNLTSHIRHIHNTHFI